MQEQMGNTSRKVEIIRKNFLKARDLKHCSRSEKCFNRLISKLEMTEENISKLEDKSIKSSKSKYPIGNTKQYPIGEATKGVT